MPDQGPVTLTEGPGKDTPNPDAGTTPGTPAPDVGTSPTPPPVDDGTAKAADADQPKSPAKTEDTDVFFDPKDLPEEPLAAFRASGYLERVARERAEKNKGIVASYA